LTRQIGSQARGKNTGRAKAVSSQVRIGPARIGPHRLARKPA